MDKDGGGTISFTELKEVLSTLDFNIEDKQI
jgi:Ca2+-binding EF-hand superfamily protein